jgi:hypothetical protein
LGLIQNRQNFVRGTCHEDNPIRLGKGCQSLGKDSFVQPVGRVVHPQAGSHDF